ncbi:MAG: tRNA 4-thiouridine(8) synthase ThiI [PVC group bacterium]|nr:tRNA 4-thiouridine(8) synthase ThiI [PVC group bacterium]
MNKQVRAIGLLSGGLDSILAIKVVQQQGIEVTGLSFVTPFFNANAAQKAADQLGVPLIIKDITAEHFKIVKNPPHGYGKTMNPCIDCHALMVKIAGGIMQGEGFDFIFTGEVLNERPMSQNRASLEIVAKTSGYKEYLIRPLSAKFLNQTKPEQEGIVDHSKFLDLQGRSRKRQIAMAREFGVKEYPNPAGGCLLTDKGFSNRLRELLSYNEDPSVRELRLLRLGRHFRLADTAKLIVGRNQQENEVLESLFESQGYMIMTDDEISGPTCLLIGDNLSEYLERCALICAAYSDVAPGIECPVNIKHASKVSKTTVITDRSHRETDRI